MDNFRLTSTLKGQRFSGHHVPVDVLSDFAALEQLLVELAKQEYLRDNPSRKRVPAGFSSGLELSLESVTEGSAVLAFTFSSPAGSAAPGLPYLERAYGKLTEALHLVAAGGSSGLEAAILNYFDRFGRSLRPDEALLFDHPRFPATFTAKTRVQLLSSSETSDWTESRTVKGRVSAADKSNAVFNLELADGQKVSGLILDTHRQLIMKAFDEYEQQMHIAVNGWVRRDRSGRMRSFESIDRVSVVDPLDIELRLEQLALLPDGWLDGKGKALSRECVRLLAASFEAHYAPTLPLPYLYPTPEGGVQAEWSGPDWEVSLEISLPSFAAELQAVRVADSFTREKKFQLKPESPDWVELNSTLASILQAEQK